MSTSTAAKIPPLIYGTAWKKDQTRKLVRQALLVGFTGVDTAAQPKHYQEDLVGQGIRDAIKEGGLKRSHLYIQTKFTSIHGQDPRRMPYDAQQNITDQLAVSIASSLHNLRHSETTADAYLDCLVLHSPFPSLAQTQEAWRAMESHVPARARTLGISNIYSIDVLKSLYDFARVKPAIVQNRFYADSGYDVEIRAFCAANGVRYQSFWTLTANPRLLKSEAVETVAREVGVGLPVALYGLVLGLGEVSVLNGTTNVGRMTEDLEGVKKIRQWATSAPQSWREVSASFGKLLQT